MIELKTYKMVDEKYCTDCVCVIPSEVYLKKDADAAIAELKQKLEDAGMENRKLKRALWIARANKAESEARGWYHSNAYIIKYDGLHNIKGVLYGKGFKRYPEEWMKLWIKIERLCLAKAKEYK